MVGSVEGAVCGPPRAVVARLGRPRGNASPVANGSPGGPPAMAAAAPVGMLGGRLIGRAGGPIGTPGGPPATTAAALVGMSGGKLAGTAGGPTAMAAAAPVGMSGGKLAGMVGGPPVIAVAALVGSSVLSSATTRV